VHLTDHLGLAIYDLDGAILLDLGRQVIARIDPWTVMGCAQIVNFADEHLVRMNLWSP
jgi:hypothetical protein